MKIILQFNDYKTCLLNNEIKLKSQQRFKSETHNVCTEETNKIALTSSFKSNPYGTSVGKVCKSQLLSKYKWLTLMNKKK